MTRKQAEAPVKERLSRERIVENALALADAEGLDAVTIRRLAQDQGVTPMALYWHFKDKDRLLDGIAERLLSEVLLPADEPDPGRWEEQFRDLLAAVLAVLRAHPAVTELVQTRFMLSVAGLNITERALGLLRMAGFSPEQSAQVASHGLTAIVQLVTSEPGALVGEDIAEREQRLRTKKAMLQTLSPQRYPNVLASSDAFIECSSTPAYFELGLDLFIAGVRGTQPVH